MLSAAGLTVSKRCDRSESRKPFPKLPSGPVISSGQDQPGAFLQLIILVPVSASSSHLTVFPSLFFVSSYAQQRGRGRRGEISKFQKWLKGVRRNHQWHRWEETEKRSHCIGGRCTWGVNQRAGSRSMCLATPLFPGCYGLVIQALGSHARNFRLCSCCYWCFTHYLWS